MTGTQRMRWSAGVVAGLAMAFGTAAGPAAQSAPKATPDTPFKLMTFEAGGSTRIGLVLGARVLDIAGANRHVAERAKLPAVAIPTEMKALIEQYATVSPRLYQIANFFGMQSTAGLPVAFDVPAVTVKGCARRSRRCHRSRTDAPGARGPGVGAQVTGTRGAVR